MGQEYSALAALLAKDIARFSPGSSFVVLTDRPDEFNYHANVLAFNHWQQSMGCYQDKVYAVREALSLFDSCMFLDADMRILAPFQPGDNWLPGITARSCCSISKHFVTQVNPTQQAQREQLVVEKAARKLHLELQDKQIKFVHEFLFVVTKDSGKEATFLMLWEQIGRLFELNGLYSGEGHAIGLAAAKAGLSIRHDLMGNFEFFKDKIEQVKIQKGQSDASETLAYFAARNQLAHADRSLPYKSLEKLQKYVRWIDRSVRLRIASLKNFDFYYR
jgi:hypothetical protein